VSHTDALLTTADRAPHSLHAPGAQEHGEGQVTEWRQSSMGEGEEAGVLGEQGQQRGQAAQSTPPMLLGPAHRTAHALPYVPQHWPHNNTAAVVQLARPVSASTCAVPCPCLWPCMMYGQG